MNKCNTLEEAIEIYNEGKAVRIVNLKQILAYAAHGLQPIWITEGYDNKLVCYYGKEESKIYFDKWRKYELESGVRNK